MLQLVKAKFLAILYTIGQFNLQQCFMFYKLISIL